jgi:anion-transporting  ArsA/GET3 family ATPase
MVLGVIGGSGGVGASTFSAALAERAAQEYGHAALVDLDPGRGGVDVLLGIEAVPGARWSGLQLDGGQLDPQALLQGLPSWREVAVLCRGSVHRTEHRQRVAGHRHRDAVRSGDLGPGPITWLGSRRRAL